MKQNVKNVKMSLEILVSASTVDEQHQFRLDNWVPTEKVIVNQDREQ